MLIMVIALLAANAEPNRATAIVEVAQSQICIPEGFYLLIRHKKSLGAVRLQNVRAMNQPGTGEADYASYFSQDGSGFMSPATVQHHGRVTEAPLVGLGRLSVQPGDTRVRVGPFNFDYSFPGCIGMYQVGRAERDEGFEFAPTDVKELRSLDPAGSWRWFRVEKNRRLSLPLSEIRQHAAASPKP